MPQATEEHRRAWGTDGGCGDEKALQHLERRGYKLLPDWTWQKPGPDFEPSEDDIGAICFLIDEWDFGGLHV